MSFFSKVAKSGAGSYVIPSGNSWLEPPKPQPFTELGVTGLLRTKGTGYVFEEWLASLSTYRQRQVYREMRDNDPIIGALFFAVEMILRRAEWFVEAPSAKGEPVARFVETCLDDMSHTWEDFICEMVSMLTFGFSLSETVYKRRMGPRKKGGSASKFSDGLIGWKKMAPRAQESILYWQWDDDGDLIGVVQLAAPDYQTISMPMESMLLFQTTSLKENPEGRSVLRNCFRPWSFKKRLEEVEGIGIERDICGMPVLYATEQAKRAAGGEAALRKLVRDVRIDDQMGIVLPQAFDQQNNPQVKLELMKSAGAKQTDVGATIRRYDQAILNTMMAGFIESGQTEHGARSLHLSQTQIFAEAIEAYLDSAAAVMNRKAIPQLMALNGMDLELCPILKHGDIGVRDLEEIGNFIQKLSASGIPFIDEATVSYLRKLAKLPEAPVDAPPNIPLDDSDEPTEDFPTPKQRAPRMRTPVAAAPNQGAAGDRLEATA